MDLTMWPGMAIAYKIAAVFHNVDGTGILRLRMIPTSLSGIPAFHSPVNVQIKGRLLGGAYADFWYSDATAGLP